MAALVRVAGVRTVSFENQPSQSTNSNVEVSRIRIRSLNVLSGSLDGTSVEVQRRPRCGNVDVADIRVHHLRYLLSPGMPYSKSHKAAFSGNVIEEPFFRKHAHAT